MKKLLTLFIVLAFSVSLALAQGEGSGGGGPVKSQAQLKLTPQQKTELLRQWLPGHVRRSPQITNPAAASFNAAILSSLRSQRQGADADLAALAAVDGSVRPTSSDFPPQSAGLPAKNSAKPGNSLPPPRVQVSGTPEHPGAAQQALACLHPGIATVNGKTSGIIFTPIAELNLYTIKGCGFGQSGNVYLQGPFAGGRIPLRVQIQKTKNAVLGTWSDGLIVVSMDPNLSGEISHLDGVTLMVEPAGGSPLQKQVAFFPAQETVFLDRVPGWIPKFAQPAPDANHGFTSPSLLTPGMTLDVARTDHVDGQSVNGKDVFDLNAMTDGFSVTSAQLNFYNYFSQPQPGAPNQSYNVTSWDLGWGDGAKSLFVLWYTGAMYGGGDQALFGSYYSLSIWVIGPRGVSPFRTSVPRLPNPAILAH